MLRFVLSIAFLVVLGGAFAPREATASCGDWLAHPQMSHDEGRINEGGEELPATPGTCQGPLCGQAPMAPIQLPTDRVVERYHQEMACLHGHACKTPSFDDRMIAEFDLFLPSGVTLGIYRPPKS